MKTLIRAIFFVVYLFFYILIGNSLGTTPIKNQSNENKMSETKEAVPKPFNGNAKWIWTSIGTRNPKNHIDNYRVAYFRRNFEVADENFRLVIHVSADSRYVLWCNGQFVGRGPAKGDITHHFYDMFDLDHLLRIGKNVIAAQVMSYAPSWIEYNVGAPPASVMTVTNGFVLDGSVIGSNGNVIEKLHTDSNWHVAADSAYQHEPRPEVKAIVGLFENFNGKNYPWGWQEIDFDDSEWEPATELTKAVRPDNVADSFMPFRLIPRIIPFMEETKDRFSHVVRCEAIESEGAERLVQKDEALEIPAHTTVKILYDVGYETTAFPMITTEGGKGATIRMKYAEVLFRNKQKLRIPDDQPFDFIGYWDEYLPAGNNATYEPFWWRTFRFLELTINTADAPVTIQKFAFRFIGYPFKMEARFESSDPDHKKMWEVSWRTLRLCAHETFEDCPYWEQLQYAGDTQVSALLALYMAGDHFLTRQALRQFDWSRDWEGITKSRYPSRVPQIIPFWSLHWICMNYDYYYHTGDLDEIKERFNGLATVIDWFNRLRNTNGLIANVPYWCVADWSPDWHDPVWGWGIPPGTKDSASALVNFMYISCLKKTAELAERIGKNDIAADFLLRADEMTKAANTTFWSYKENLYTDRPEGPEVSQLTNAWAILSGVADNDKTKKICQRLVNDSRLCRTAFFGKFFVFRALSQANVYDQAFALFQPWRDLLKMGCTTWPEDPSLGRSECHVWSSAPAYEFLSEILGVKPLAPGYSKILIQPKLGDLQWARGHVPTPRGDVHVDCRFDDNEFKIKGQTPDATSVLIIMPSGTKKELKSGGDFFYSEPR